jgi:hypothetical protein
MHHRRVLILVNGSNDVTELKRLSLNESAPDIPQWLDCEWIHQTGRVCNLPPAEALIAGHPSSQVG